MQLVLERQLAIPEAAGRRQPVMELEAELSRLKRDLAEARMERDILRTATAYVVAAQLPGKRS